MKSTLYTCQYTIDHVHLQVKRVFKSEHKTHIKFLTPLLGSWGW